MKRIAALLLILSLLAGFAACAEKKPAETPGGETRTVETPSGGGQSGPSGAQTDGPSENTDGEDFAVRLSEEDVDLFKGSYDILRDRITDRGYAITSLTGTYVGMFTRDSSIQAMAHLAYGDSDAARAILRYLLSCHAALGLNHGTHIIDELREEEYRNGYLAASGGQSGGDAVGWQIAQRNAETPIYALNAPNNGAAQPFVPKNPLVRSVEAHLTKSGNNDTVNVKICKDYRDPSTTVAEADYVFGDHPSGWQTIVFDEPAAVTPGETYYLVLQATKAAGKVIWNGTTVRENSENSINYDVAALGGWAEKPYFPAFEILSFKTDAAAKGFTARGSAVAGVDLNVYAGKAGGTVRAEIRSDPDDPASALAYAERTIDRAGENLCALTFDRPANVQNGEYYYLTVFFSGAPDAVRLMTAPSSSADTRAFADGWEEVGYEFLANPVFTSDRAPLITLDAGAVGVQEIPTSGEMITSVKVLLSKDAGAAGRVRATLYKGNGEDAQTIDSKTVDISEIGEDPDWTLFRFDLPLFKTKKAGSYYLALEAECTGGSVYWCGSDSVDRYETYTEKDGVKTPVTGDAGYEALRGILRQISDYTQTDTTYMLIHAWVMFANNNKGTPEDQAFIEQSYPLIKTFANFYLDRGEYFDKKLNLVRNPSLEHSRKGRYWIAYDLITNVFASQALYELSAVAEKLQDEKAAEKWMIYAKRIEKGINANLVTEYDGKKIYGEFYDAEDKMKFYPGISWVNFAPVAAEWYGMDLEIMKNTYEVYKKYAGIKMNGYNGLATDATLGTDEIRRELIGKGVAWELMFCKTIGDSARAAEIMALERATAKRYRLTVYPESWVSESFVSDPGNQEHCAWQVYAVCKVFPELAEEAKG